jgi:hypothetical protein
MLNVEVLGGGRRVSEIDWHGHDRARLRRAVAMASGCRPESPQMTSQTSSSAILYASLYSVLRTLWLPSNRHLIYR